VTPKVAERVAFVHVMKTAGSFVNRHMSSALRDRGYRTFNSWAEMGRDFTLEELEGFRGQGHERAYVHNHAGGWDEATVRRYQDSGWFVFSFARPPGERWCSFYHWAQGRKAVSGQTLDDFLRQAFSGKMTAQRYANLDIPEYWERLDFVAPFSNSAFAVFLDRHFGIEFHAEAARPVNVSGNPGYEKCLESGQISAETDRLVRASRQFEIYEAIRARGVPVMKPSAGDSKPGLL
jgi:hypothetical protein